MLYGGARQRRQRQEDASDHHGTESPDSARARPAPWLARDLARRLPHDDWTVRRRGHDGNRRARTGCVVQRDERLLVQPFHNLQHLRRALDQRRFLRPHAPHARRRSPGGAACRDGSGISVSGIRVRGDRWHHGCRSARSSRCSRPGGRVLRACARGGAAPWGGWAWGHACYNRRLAVPPGGVVRPHPAASRMCWHLNRRQSQYARGCRHARQAGVYRRAGRQREGRY